MNEDNIPHKDLEYYLEIGAVTLEGVDETGEMIFAINEKAKELAPELWEAHHDYVDNSLMQLYEMGVLEVEYNENLEATLHLTEEGKQMAKEMGLIEMDLPEIPND